MYPVLRLASELVRHRRAPRLRLTEEHRATHVCWPWDVDLWRELNNGRVLTLYDLGRVVLFVRLGIVPVLRRRRWAGVIAGASIRYRRRVRAFDRYELRSRMIGWDERFFYAEQSMWRNGECTSHALLRMAITSADGLVPAPEAAAALDGPDASPPLPDWVRAWIAAEAARPWPPMQGD
jgi:acyl-CoA thioesterase FadM